MGTHKSVGGAETLGVGGLNLPMKKDEHRANLYSQSVQQAINKPCMMCVVKFFLPSHSYSVLSGDGLVGGNPTMNTPLLRRGGGIASSSFILFYSTCIGIVLSAGPY